MKPRVFEMRWLEATPPVRKGRLSRDEKAEWAERSDRLGREVAKIRARYRTDEEYRERKKAQSRKTRMKKSQEEPCKRN